MFEPLRRLPILLLTIAGLCGTGTAHSQQWWVDASVGGISHRSVAARLVTRSAALGVRREGALWVQLAGGVPLDENGARWAAAAAGGELATPGRVSLGILASTQGYGYTLPSVETGWGAVSEVGPFVRFRRGPFALELRPGGILSWTRTYGVDTLHALPSLALRGGVATVAGLQLDGVGQVVRSGSTTYPYSSLTVWQDLGWGGWWSSLGRWWSDEIPTAEWMVGGFAELGSRLQVQASLRRDTNDPIYRRQPRRIWSASLSYAVGRRPAPVSPLPAPVAAESGEVTFLVPIADSGSRPAIAGDFNGWMPVEMSRAGEHWTVTLTIPPGTYRFSFRDPEGRWFLPSSITHRIDDGFGGENGLLVVQ